jgi:dTDP-glucose 4,6-dehydratase
MSAQSPFRPRVVLLTGGAGFIGSALAREVLESSRQVERLVVLDALTYAGHRVNLAEVETDPRFAFVHGDICDRELVARLFAEHSFDTVLHLAAESHVDRSIEEGDVFVRTNVNGTFALLEAARRAWSGGERAARRFVHVSTDEVFGALGDTGVFTETSPYAPNSPYAASKAASDLMVRSFGKTYELPVVITNSCNNYGPRQLPEKVVPLMIANAVEDKPLPIYGEGKQIREWMHVDDHAIGICRAAEHGRLGESYLFGSGEESSNKALVERIADLVDDELARPAGTARALITYVQDRKGHDYRYAIDAAKAKRELGWSTARSLTEQLRDTVRWYIANGAWREAVTGAEHRRFQAAHYSGAGAPSASTTRGPA